MKTKLRLLAGLLFAAILLTSCGKDDDNPSPKNYLKIGDTEYVLSGGLLENYGTDEGNDWHDGYNVDLTLISEGISLFKEEDADWDLGGTGEYIYFEMFSKTGNALDNEKYEFSSTEPFSVGTFDYGCCESILEGEGLDNEMYLTSGSVDVSKSGNEYTITIDCVDLEGNKVTGFYKGTLQYYDYTIDDKSAILKSAKMKARKLKR